jgi:DNA-binding transcriptional regulator GbsR (MarR family)
MPDESIQSFEQTLLDLFTQAADLLGMPRSPALIYGVIFASPEPLSFADIEAKLQISKGSISQGLRLLKEIGAVKVIEPNGDRREHYEPDLEMRKLIRRFLEKKVQPQLDISTKRLELLRSQLPPPHALHRETLEERVAQLENWHAKATALLPIIKTFLALSEAKSKLLARS